MKERKDERRKKHEDERKDEDLDEQLNGTEWQEPGNIPTSIEK